MGTVIDKEVPKLTTLNGREDLIHSVKKERKYFFLVEHGYQDRDRGRRSLHAGHVFVFLSQISVGLAYLGHLRGLEQAPEMHTHWKFPDIAGTLEVPLPLRGLPP